MGPIVERPTATKQLLLTPQQTAAALAISERTLYTLTNEGKIPCVRFGRTKRYSLAAIQAIAGTSGAQS